MCMLGLPSAGSSPLSMWPLMMSSTTPALARQGAGTGPFSIVSHTGGGAGTMSLFMLLKLPQSSDRRLATGTVGSKTSSLARKELTGVFLPRLTS